MPTIRDVIANQNCIGCGACAAAFPNSAAMSMTREGHWQAEIIDEGSAELRLAGETMCPLSGGTPDETTISSTLYPGLPIDDRIGRYARNVVGHVETGESRALGGSGGLVTWLLENLIATGKIDAVLQVQPISKIREKRLLFGYGISRSVDEVRRSAKARYYPVHMADVLTQLRNEEGRYAVVGLPCFIKAVRLMERSGDIPPGRIHFTVGLVCGHLKSRYFGEYLAWQKGVPPPDLASFDFRRKLPDRPASNYAFAFRRDDSADEQIHPMKSVKGWDWGEGLFKNPACEFCDDVLAECADIAVGDAWLPGHVDDPRGTNVAVIRSLRLKQIISDAERQGDLALEDVSPDIVAQSQAAGLRHRRRGLMHRLARRKSAGQWAPKKRVPPRLETNASRRQVYDLRLQIAQESSAAFAVALETGQLGYFEERMAPAIAAYRIALKGSMAQRFKNQVTSLRKLFARGK